MTTISISSTRVSQIDSSRLPIDTHAHGSHAMVAEHHTINKLLTIFRQSGGHEVLHVLILRLLPFAVYAVCSARVGSRPKIALSIAYVATTIGYLATGGSSVSILAIAVGFSYYAGASLLIYRLSALFQKGMITRPALFLSL